MNEKQKRIYRIIQWCSTVDVALLIGLWIIGPRMGMHPAGLYGFTYDLVLFLVMMIVAVGPLKVFARNKPPE